MSKAYDRVEWIFIKKMMLHMGFDVKFVDEVIRCVITTSFSTIINGEPIVFFEPQRGLRQGDPLSPYLFIICVEGLSSLFQATEQNGTFPKLMASKGGPWVSHLFFDDDSVIFGDAVPSQTYEIRRILYTYEVASGQRINLEKSVVVFSKNTTIEAR